MYTEETRIPICEPTLAGNEREYLMKCIESNWLSSKGFYVNEFENKFSEFCGSKYGVATSSGTTALHLSLAVLGIGRKDEVIIPSLTMIASANPVIFAGATPVFVDSESETWNIDVSKIEDKITQNTKAIMPVHIYGHPVDMGPLLDIAEKHDLWVIEDAAEAHGAEYKGRRAGSIGHVGCFSFYTNKIITTGEGGMVITDNDEIHDRLVNLRDLAHSKEQRYLHYEIGFNYRLTNLQAGVGLAQMKKINDFIGARREHARIYNSLLRDVDGIELPPEADNVKNVYWLYSILVEDDFGIKRDDLELGLYNKGIETRPFFIPMHQQPVFQKMGLVKGEFPIADELGKKGICLPSSSSLKKDQIEYVCDSIKCLQNSAK